MHMHSGDSLSNTKQLKCASVIFIDEWGIIAALPCENHIRSQTLKAIFPLYSRLAMVTYVITIRSRFHINTPSIYRICYCGSTNVYQVLIDHKRASTRGKSQSPFANNIDQ